MDRRTEPGRSDKLRKGGTMILLFVGFAFIAFALALIVSVDKSDCKCSKLTRMGIERANRSKK